jgi:hypothetical protein
MFCSQCGNSVAEGSATCPRCGTSLSRSQGSNVRVGAPGASGAPGAPGASAGYSPSGTPGGYSPSGAPGGYSPSGGPAPFGGSMGPAPSGTPAFSFDLKRLTRNDQIVGGATIVFIISLFLPWFTSSAGIYSGSVNGLWHGYMYLPLLISLAVLVFLVLRAGFEALPFKMPVDDEVALLIATGVTFVLTVLSFVFKPSGDGIVSIGWGFGAFIGLIAAAVAVAPLGVPFLRSRAGH